MQFCKILTQSMHSEHFLIFYRKITKSSIFFNKNAHNIFVELFTPVIEMHKVNTNEVHVLHAKCKKNSSFYGSLASFIFYPMYVYGAIFNFLIIWVQLSFIVFPSCHELGPHMTHLCGWFHKILPRLRKII